MSLDSPSIEANRVIYDAFQLIEKQRLVYNQLYRVGKTLETVDKGFRVVYLGADRVPSFPREIPLGRGNIDDYITNTSYNRNTEIFANIYSTGSFDYIGQSLARIAEEYLYLRWSKLEANPLDHIQEFKDIAATIQKCLDLELTATNPSLPVEPIVFEFVRDGHKMQFEQLSSGEKSLIYFVFTLANPATRNSFIIIDEAEIHLHGNMQDELLSILFSKKEFNNQHFVSTHSPKLINGLTISSVLSVTLYI